MYKKITHNIVEEHFAHPSAAQIKNAVDLKKIGKAVKNLKSKGSYYSDDEEYYGLDQFEKQNIYVWSSLAWVLGDLVKSVVDNAGDQAELTARLVTIIDKLSAAIAPIATDTQIKQFYDLLTAWATSALAVLTDTVAGKDATYDVKALTDSIAALAAFLNSLATTWDAATVTKILTTVSNLYVAQATARMKKDWAGSTAVSGNAYKILVEHQDDGNASLADIFAAGINC